MSTNVWLRRAYTPPTRNDGRRVLVDRLWPRGVSHEAVHVDEWFRDLAPSTDLRRWFGHDPARWDEFQARYRSELAQAPARAQDQIECLIRLARHGRVTLVFAAKDQDRNNAVVLRQIIEEQAPAVVRAGKVRT